MRSFVGRIIGRARAGAADGDVRALGAEGLRDAVADAAGAADHQHLPAAEIQFVHPCFRSPLRVLMSWHVLSEPVPFPDHVVFDLSADRCQPCQSCTRAPSLHRRGSHHVRFQTAQPLGQRPDRSRHRRRQRHGPRHGAACSPPRAPMSPSPISTPRPRRPSPTKSPQPAASAKAWTLDVAKPDDIIKVVNDVAAHFGSPRHRHQQRRHLRARRDRR